MSSQKTPHPSNLEPEPGQKADDLAHNGITRRSFLKGAGITAAGTSLLEGVQAFAQETKAASSAVRHFGPGPAPIKLLVNGKEHAVEVEPRTTLAEALRNQLGLTGTKVICDRGSCSGCTVFLDKTPVNSCTTLAIDAIGHSVTTIEGLSADGKPHPLQAAFVKHDAMQCGFCTPGMVMSCASLLQKNSHPSDKDVRQAIAGNLCRCGTYPRVIAATLETAGSTHKA
jgi:xanthine dehydrogenase YagT iron-sulfur-binding subunit